MHSLDNVSNADIKILNVKGRGLNVCEWTNIHIFFGFLSYKHLVGIYSIIKVIE